MGQRLKLKDAEKAKQSITKSQKVRIAKMYKQVSDQISKEIKQLDKRDNISSVLKKTQLRKLQLQIERNLTEVNNEIQGLISDNVAKVTASVAGNVEKVSNDMGFVGVHGLYTKAHRDVVENVLAGKIYTKPRPLSQSIWTNNAKQLQDINEIIAQGIALNKSAYDIGKDLEKYVSPSRKKDWQWSKVYPGTSKHIDYNAQRLARTLVQHAYQQSLVGLTKKNPFVLKYRWNSALVERTCDICRERNGMLYDKDNVPMDHPNGLCTIEPVTEDLSVVADKIADWYDSPEGTYPEIDEYAKDINARMPFELKKVILRDDQVKNVKQDPVINIEYVRNLFKNVLEDDVVEAMLKDGYQDEVGKMIVDKIGFGEKPTKVKIFSDGTRVLYRGVNGSKAKEYVDSFKNGDMFYGKGIYGNGVYFGDGKNAKAIALEYAGKDESNLIEAGLKKDAKVGKLNDVYNDYKKNFLDKMSSYSDKEQILFSDVGRWAMVNGYDAIEVEEMNYVVVFNRSKLEVKA